VLITIYIGMRDPNQLFTVKNLDYLFEQQLLFQEHKKGSYF